MTDELSRVNKVSFVGISIFMVRIMFPLKKALKL